LSNGERSEVKLNKEEGSREGREERDGEGEERKHKRGRGREKMRSLGALSVMSFVRRLRRQRD
jgi:hypothetical protein